MIKAFSRNQINSRLEWWIVALDCWPLWCKISPRNVASWRNKQRLSCKTNHKVISGVRACTLKLNTRKFTIFLIQSVLLLLLLISCCLFATAAAARLHFCVEQIFGVSVKFYRRTNKKIFITRSLASVGGEHARAPNAMETTHWTKKEREKLFNLIRVWVPLSLTPFLSRCRTVHRHTAHASVKFKYHSIKITLTPWLFTCAIKIYTVPVFAVQRSGV